MHLYLNKSGIFASSDPWSQYSKLIKHKNDSCKKATLI